MFGKSKEKEASTIRVRAKQHGQYKGVMYNPGDIFEIEDTTYPIYEVDGNSHVVKDEKGEPKILSEKHHLEHWMEKVEDTN